MDRIGKILFMYSLPRCILVICALQSFLLSSSHCSCIACDAAPQIIATQDGSPDVFAEGIGVVRKGDNEQSHTFPGCAIHQTGLADGSPDVFANGLPIGRKDDVYNCGAQITTVNQSTVFANGG